MPRRALPLLILLLAGQVTPSAASTATLRFEDGTAAARLTSMVPANDPMKGAYIHAAAWGDVDGDGDADLFVGTFTDTLSPADYYRQRGATGPMPNRLFINDGTGRFATSNQPALALYGVTSGAVFADLDGDLDDDLVVSSYTRSPTAGRLPSDRSYELNHLYRNDRGVFTDVTSGSGIRPGYFTSGRAVGVLDYDGDGCLDLFLVADGLLGNPTSSRLLRGDCALHFADVTSVAGVASAQGEIVQGLGVAVGDVDGDGRPDLFVAGGPKRNPRRNFLFRNKGDGTFAEVSGGTMFLDPPGVTGATEDWTSAASFGDLNRDGKLDLVVSYHFGSGADGTPIKPQIYLNGSTGSTVSFRKVTTATGVQGIASKTPHVEIADLDNDGWPDIYLSVLVGAAAQPAVYRNTGTLRNGVPTFTSPSDRSNPHYYPGGPLADVDRDGLLEPFLSEYKPELVPTLERNRSTGTGNWIEVVARSPRNTDGVGATVRIYRRDGATRTLIGAAPIQIGNGFSSSSMPVAHFGVGPLTRVDVEVTPPGGGTVKTQTNVAVNQRIRVTF